MHRQHHFAPQAPQDALPPKKAYVTPQLQSWGSIVDLTQGGKIGFEDLPKQASGTRDSV